MTKTTESSIVSALGIRSENSRGSANSSSESKPDSTRPAVLQIAIGILPTNPRGRTFAEIIPQLHTNRRNNDGSTEEARNNEIPANNMLLDLLADISPTASSPHPIQREKFERAEQRRSKMFKDFNLNASMDGVLSDYKVDHTIGEGCFSRVKLGTHIPTNLKVAVKCIDKLAITKAVGTAERILREILVLKHIHHPNITRLLEVVEQPNYIYLILEYEEGGELFDYIVKNEKVDEDKARIFFRQMVSAIQYCHAHCITHRDLKPENILLDAEGNIKLIDFGLANVMRPDESLETFCGSAAYAAPEMLSRKPYKGNEADIWSLGVILFVMLSGQPPFDDRQVSKMYASIMMGRYSFPKSFPEGAKDLVSKILKTKTSERATLEAIRDHPWMNKNGELPNLSFEPVSLEGAVDDDQDFLKDPATVERILEIGYTQTEIDDALRTRDPGPIVAAYYLIRKEMGNNPTLESRAGRLIQVSSTEVSKTATLTVEIDSSFTPRSAKAMEAIPLSSKAVTPQSAKSSSTQHSDHSGHGNYIAQSATRSIRAASLETSRGSPMSMTSPNENGMVDNSLISKIRSKVSPASSPTASSPTKESGFEPMTCTHSAEKAPTKWSFLSPLPKPSATQTLQRNFAAHCIDALEQKSGAFLCTWSNPLQIDGIWSEASSPDNAVEAIVDQLMSEELGPVQFAVNFQKTFSKEGDPRTLVTFTTESSIAEARFSKLMQLVGSGL
ncbi:hypothetical protein HDU97_002636 [Phlyctochytrium planicorne]|nr:hypothetical protein HDU97_002636 [Phlyctochytrium planicorne]